MPSPEATYDSLFIVRHLEESLHGVTASEVQLFGYLARLLAVYRGIPSAEWGYFFARTNHGAPFAPDASEAIDDLLASGLICRRVQDTATTFTCTTEGASVCDVLGELEISKWRRPFLEAACSSSLTLPVSTIREALRAEPTIKSATSHIGPQELLSGPALELLYEQFGALREVLGELSDLLVPSAVWLAYLLEQSKLMPGNAEGPSGSSS